MSLLAAFAKAGYLFSPNGSNTESKSSLSPSQASYTRRRTSSSSPSPSRNYRSSPVHVSRHKTSSAVRGAKITKREQCQSQLAEKKRRTLWGLPLFSAVFGPYIHSAPEDESLGVETTVEEEEEPQQDRNEFPFMDDEQSHEMVNREQKTVTLKDQLLDPEDVRIQDWSEDEVWVYNKLVMRGYEPIFPQSWAPDFQSFPDQLFTRNAARTFVNNLTTPVFEACVAFNALVQAGPNCRSQLTSAKTPEPAIRRALDTFHRWALRDGNLRHKRFTPLIVTVVARPNESPAHVFDRCHARLRKNGRRWRRRSSVSGHPACDRLPTLYGVVVKYSVMAIVSWDPNDPTRGGSGSSVSSTSTDDLKMDSTLNPVRTLGTYNWKTVGHDVWHALAVGVVECKARNYLMALAAKGELGEDIVESDPDL